MGEVRRGGVAPRPAQLIVFAKTPRPGHVKTRLCPPLRPREAKTIYRAFLEDLLARLGEREDDWRGAIHVAPPVDRGLFRRLAPRGWTLAAQRGRELLERITNALQGAIDTGSSAACVVGSDVPLLDASRIREAFRKLHRGPGDVVLGADRGGGYYLLGVRQGVRRGWRLAVREGRGMARDTRAALRRRGIGVQSLPVEEDCDLPEDLRRLAARIRDAPDRAPATSIVLRRLLARGRLDPAAGE